MGFVERGYLEYKELEELKELPTKERYKKGPVAIAECVQCIPCNPCESACVKHALKVGKPITNCPQITYEDCTGCGMCVAKCPGMAIFVVDKSYSDTKATVAFPYEYYPLPKEGDVVQAVDRKGEVRCEAKVIKVRNPLSFDHTPVITIEVPMELADEVRSMERIKEIAEEEAGWNI